MNLLIVKINLVLGVIGLGSFHKLLLHFLAFFDLVCAFYVLKTANLNGRYIPGYTVSRKVSGKQVKKYPDIQFQRNFLKFLKVSQKS